MNEETMQKLRELIKEYGMEAFEKIIQIVRPFIPLVVSNQELIPIAVALAGTLLPMAIGSTVMAAEILSSVSLFGVKTGLAATKVGYGAAKMTVEVATDVLIKKPIYLLSYPFRKQSQGKEVMQMLETCKLQEAELANYKKAYGKAAKEPEKLFLIIRQIGDGQVRKDKDIKMMIGSLQRNDRVERLLPIIKKTCKEAEKDSVQFICDRNVLTLGTSLSSLPRNEFGAIQIYFVMMQTFG